jgi:surfactin synthase thioesterase subunit
MVFAFLREYLRDTDVMLTPAILPGRERRLSETPHRSMDTLLAEFEEVAHADGYSAFMGDYGLLGHCSGALVAYEVARILQRSPCRSPQLLVVCSCLPPPLVRDTGISGLPTEQLFSQTSSMGGTPSTLLGNPDFLQVLERPLRADWVLFDTYVHRASTPLTVPILAVRGADDPDLPAAVLERWRHETSEEFLAATLESGHWMLTEAGSRALARQIPAALAEIRGGAGHRTRA